MSKANKKDNKKRKYYPEHTKKNPFNEDDLFLIEATKTINQKKADSTGIVGKCGKFVFLNSGTVDFKVYEEEDGTTVITATKIEV